MPGPNVATFVLPIECFPPNLRGSFHGMSAAAAKVGAVVGAFLFPAVSRAAGMAAVMWLQAGVSVAGAVLVAFTLPLVLPYSNEKTPAAILTEAELDHDGAAAMPLCDYDESVHDAGTALLPSSAFSISSSSESDGDSGAHDSMSGDDV